MIGMACRAIPANGDLMLAVAMVWGMDPHAVGIDIGSIACLGLNYADCQKDKP